ncbi:MAG: argininosuccinate lyase [Treponema sp.]|nr:argininosuccinate lyase [Treponema sp.]
METHGTMTKGNHAALWHGRFSDGPDAEAVAFETSIHVDERMAHDDIQGSKAHVQMLAKAKLISQKEADEMCDALVAIDADIASGALKIDASSEDIHSFIEACLTDRIGEVGKKIHTGRSRNDQIALDERLYLRRIVPELQKQLRTLIGTLASIAEKHTLSLMPGFTHMQHAQVVTLAHHVCAWAWSFVRDVERLSDAVKRIAFSPIGSGALAGSTLPLDRAYEAKSLGFTGVTPNSLDSVSDRDYCIEVTSALAIVQMHLSRCCEEVVLWASNEFAFLELSEKWSTGSSLMPQKKNPDFAELIRGRTGKVYGDLIALLVMMKGLPLAYNRDMQEDKASLFSALDTVSSCVGVFTNMIATATWNVEHMEHACDSGYLNATDVAEYLVKKNIPFRTAHGIAAQAVKLALEKKCALEKLSLADFKRCSPEIEEDIFAILSADSGLAARKTEGAPSPERVEKQIAALKQFANDNIP